MPSSRTNRVFLGLVLGVCLLVIGAVVGGIIAGLMNNSGMGFDEIAAALGGVMVGGVGGLVVAFLIARRAQPRQLGMVVAGALVMAVGIVAYGFVRVQRDIARAEAEATKGPGPTTVPR